MTTYSAPVDVYNAAILQIGARPISLTTDNSAEARILNGTYQGKVDEMLTKHAWTWATKQQVLTPKDQALDGQWRFALPHDCLNLRYITINGSRVDIIEMQEDHIIFPTKDTDLVAHYTYKIPPSRWPADFAEAVVDRLIAVLYSGLLSEFSKAEQKNSLADKKMREAMVRDRRQIRGRESNPDPHMVRARRRGGNLRRP